MKQCAVAIVGAGPVGTMLAAELMLGGVAAIVFERRAHAGIESVRALGLHSRSLEVFEQRGIADRFLAAGDAVQVGSLAGVSLDLTDFPTRHPYGLSLRQRHTERILREWATELGVQVRYDCEVTGLVQRGDGVTVELSDGSSVWAEYVVGCDGGRSSVRRFAGIDFPGVEATASSIIAEVEMTGNPEFGVRPSVLGVNAMGPADDGLVRVVIARDYADAPDRELTLEELRLAITSVWGSDFGLESASYISSFTDAARQVAAYRDRRVLLAGDAAHVHSPVGGQGIGLGVQDAVNLGWKLAQVVQGVAPASLLDTYHAERHPVIARILRSVVVQATLQRGDQRTTALNEIIADLLEVPAARDRITGLVSGLDIHYDLGGDHPLVGRRMPDVDLETTDGARRVSTLLHAAKPALVDFDTPGLQEIATGWADRVPVVPAAYNGAWHLPVLGPIAPPSAVLIRPDGYVAWASEGSSCGLADSLEAWFGAS